VCLGEVGQVVEVTGGGAEALVRVGGDLVRRAALLALDGPVTVDDWVLIHSGFVLSRLTEEQAHEAEKLRGNNPILSEELP
jgi:hydrogenase expression/formation protein HypC